MPEQVDGVYSPEPSEEVHVWLPMLRVLKLSAGAMHLCGPTPLVRVVDQLFLL